MSSLVSTHKASRGGPHILVTDTRHQDHGPVVTPLQGTQSLFAVVLASGQGVTAFGASSPSPDRAAGIAAAQSRSAAAGLALGLGSGEKLVVKDVIVDPDGSTHVRYNRTFNGLRVIGGDLVSHQDKVGKLK